MAGLAAVLVAGTVAGSNRVGQDLAAAATEALGAAGYDAVEVEVAGREAVIRGHGTEAEFDAARATVEQVRGVRRVDTERSEPLPASLRLSRIEAGVRVTGAVYDRDFAERLRSAVAAASGMHVIGRPGADPRVERARWLARTPTLAAAMPETPGLVVEVDGARVALSGTVETSADLARVEAAAAAAFPDRPVEGRPLVTALTVAEAADLLAGHAVVFADDAALSDRARTVLDEVASVLQRAPGVALEISAGGLLQGDDDPDLAQDRADAVLGYLVDGGVEAERLTATDGGEGRRVTFTVVEEAD